MPKHLHPMRQWRVEKGITLASLASDRRMKKKATIAHLSKIETGKTDPSSGLIRILSAITGIPTNEFVDFKGAK